MTNRQIFLQHIGQTSPEPLQYEIVSADGNYLYGAGGEKYLDLIGGVSVCNVGHGNKCVTNAIKKQVDKYLHVMVNGELILSPQTAYAKLLADHLPASLNSIYFTTGGSEATEGAMKLAKRYTGRTKIIAFKNAYHGSTQGALSIFGDEYWRNAFRPLLPGILHLEFNSFDSLEFINDETACVIAETIQGEAGVVIPDKKWMQALRKKCTDTGTLLILDEIQCGFGRNGTLWAFEQFGIVPDILLLAKALGGGMPLGAFIAGKNTMDAFTAHPVLGHINTFGGHPVCCAAGKAAMEYLLDEKLIESVYKKEKIFLKHLKDIPSIKSIRSCGLMIAIEFTDTHTRKTVNKRMMDRRIFTEQFLFAPEFLRITPPLTITKEEIVYACGVLEEVSEGL